MYLRFCILMAAWVLSVCNGQNNHTRAFNCGKEEKFMSYMEIAIEMMIKARNNLPSCDSATSRSTRTIDCEDMQTLGHRKSGIYTVWPESRVLNGAPLEVYCDMETDGGGWTVIQRRGNFSLPKDYFYREWSNYKTGFGDLDKEFWLGNDNIFALTNQRLCSVRFDLKDMTGETRYALYDSFWLDDEDHQYTLHIKEYSGNAGDSMAPTHVNRPFSTKDKDNDSHKGSCAQMFKGAWWYGECHQSNLNGHNYFGKHDSHADGVNWKSWKGYNESLLFTEIKIRSRKFTKLHALQNEVDTPEI